MRYHFDDLADELGITVQILSAYARAGMPMQTDVRGDKWVS